MYLYINLHSPCLIMAPCDYICFSRLVCCQIILITGVPHKWIKESKQYILSTYMRNKYLYHRIVLKIAHDKNY